MAWIKVPEGQPGIRGLMAFRPETAKPLNDLVEVLLRGTDTLSSAERELIATYVSSQNDCYYCQAIHGAVAAAHLGGNETIVRDIKRDFGSAQIPERLKALLVIAGSVQRDGKQVSSESIEHARKLGASDIDIHDTVLIAAAFCMYNRYVDGLGTEQPRDEETHRRRGIMIARDGYVEVSKQYIPQTTSR
jgi:uncharacterized peroxidase-related enzyme